MSMRKATRAKSLFLMLLTLVLTVTGIAPVLAEATLNGYGKSTGYEYVQFGTYPQDADGTVRPILWRVLKADGGEAWLLSEYILFGSPVHGDYEHYKGWEESDLYTYLNSKFIHDAFTPAEIAALINRTEDNALVTLITSDEMKDASIGFSSNNARLCESTAYAKILPDPPIFELPKTNNKGRWKPLYVYSKGKKYSPWWSRTRSSDYPHEQRRVMDEGKIGRISTGNSDLGVRPTIYLNLSLLSISSGAGTMDNPYQLTPVENAAAVNLPAVEAPVEQEPEQEALPEAQDDIPTVDLSSSEPEGQTEEMTQPEETRENTGTGSIPEITINENGEYVEVTPQAPAQEAEPEPEQDAAPVSPASQTSFSAAADPSKIHEKFPALTAEGFLPEGEAEFVYADENEGLWLYASQTLRIQINRYEGKNSSKGPLRWYEAELFAKDGSELFDFYPYDEEHYKSYGDRYKALPEKIAQQHQLVFAINSDYFIFRIERDHEESYDYPIGVIIRDGEVFYDRPRKANSTVYPPLDVMALYPDGSVSLHKNAEITAKELLSKGATDTLSFGPILVENGQVSPRSKEFGNTPNPRTGFGVVEKGHYIVVVAEGKRKGVTEGESCIWLGEKMAELGCTSAINLDGGATSVLMFMGKQLNVTGNYNSSTNRKQNELFGIGHSDAIQ